MSNTIVEKLNAIAHETSPWLKNAQQRQKNSGWIKHSQKIALAVLSALDEKKMSQKEFATLIKVTPQQVTKIVSGKSNVTIATISKIEQALGRAIIFPDSEHAVTEPLDTHADKKIVIGHKPHRSLAKNRAHIVKHASLKLPHAKKATHATDILVSKRSS